MTFSSLQCFSATNINSDEKLFFNEYCQSLNRIEIIHFNGTDIDFSGAKDLIKTTIDKKMKLSGNKDYGFKEMPRLGGTFSMYRKEEKDSKKLLTRHSNEGRGSLSALYVAVIFRQNDYDKSFIDVYIRAISSNYAFIDIIKCSEKNAVSCVNDTLADFAEIELSNHLFKQPKTYEL
jgi:hypothetical protein